MRKEIVKIVSHLFPRIIAYHAYKTLTNPRLKKIRPHEIQMLDKAAKEQIRYRKFNIQLYKWGNPDDESILLVHGWEGHSGNFADIVEALVRNGYFVLAFDGPSHGHSTKGQTNLLEFSDLVVNVLEKYRPKKIISHSFGAVVTTYALSRMPIKIEKYVLLTTPDSFLERVNYISHQVGISKKAYARLIQKLEDELKTEVSSISVSKFVTKVAVRDALILHDTSDKIIPIRQARLVNESWENSILEEIESTGHFRILREPFVINRIVAFLNNSDEN